MHLQTILKRNGTIVPFQEERIFQALQKAFAATQTDADQALLQRITDQVVHTIFTRYHARTIPAVEEIQDIIEKTIAKYKEAYELLTGKKFA